MTTFLTSRQQTRKWLMVFCSLLLFLSCVLAPGICSASNEPATTATKQAVYTITEQELTTLENNLAQLQSVNTKLQLELASQKRQLHVLREESSRLIAQLNSLQQQSQNQETSLVTANKLLEQYAIEEKRTRLRIKAQRNAWLAATILCCVGLAIK